MRRLLLGVGLLAVTGCSDFRDLFTAHADVAAEAGTQELRTEKLAGILSGGKGLRITNEAAEFVSGIWVDYSLFAQAVAKGDVLSDSATIAAAMWPQIAEMRTNIWHDTLVARRSNVSPAQVDALYSGDSVRVFQHILFTVPQGAPDMVRTKVRQNAEAALKQVRAGADFGQLAATLSADPGSAADNGYLPASPKGAYVPEFDAAGWKLQPGQTTGLVETQFGFHIIRRPEADAVRPRLKTYLDQAESGRLDSLYMEQLGTTRKLEVLEDAPQSMRTAAEDPRSANDSDKALVTFEGGSLTVSEFLRWVRALPPQYMQQLKTADDAQLTMFAKALGQNLLLLQQADSANIRLDAEDWQSMQSQYQAQLDTLRVEMGLTGDVVDSTTSEAERMKLAQLKVDEYFDLLVAGKARLRPLPATLGMVLRERGDFDFNSAGMSRAVELATAAQSQADSTSGGQPAPGMQPAPGPAPVPGGTPAPATPAPDSAAGG